MAHRYPVVLLDFDYTLADSAAGIIACSNHALSALGLPIAAPEAVRRTIGLSLASSFAELTGREDPELAQRYTTLFVEHADKIMADLTIVYPEAAPTIAQLVETGVRTGIISTKYRYRIEGVLAREGLLASFDIIIGGEDVTHHKPHPEGLLLAAERLGIAPSEALYIGDATADARAAQRAGMPFAAVLRAGVTPREFFTSYPHIALLETLCDLPALVNA